MTRAGGAPCVERVELLVKLIAPEFDMPDAEIDRTVRIVNQKLSESTMCRQKNKLQVREM